MADVAESKVTGIIKTLNVLEGDLDSLTGKVGDMKKQLNVKTLSEIDTLLEKTREMATKEAEVIIKTDKKEIIISKPSVTEMKAKDSSIFTVTADSYEEAELEVPIFSDEDIQLVSQQAGVDEEKAKSALEEAKGDLARAILLLTTG